MEKYIVYKKETLGRVVYTYPGTILIENHRGWLLKGGLPAWRYPNFQVKPEDFENGNIRDATIADFEYFEVLPPPDFAEKEEQGIA